MPNSGGGILDYPGQIVIDKIEILSMNGMAYNIIPQMVQIDLFEDLSKPYITGTLYINESLDLINLFPLVGEEVLTLEFHTPGIDDTRKTRKFIIYRMSSLEPIADKSNKFLLHFISIEKAFDLNMKLSRTFEGRISEIVKTILLDPKILGTTKNITVEDTSNVTAFTACYWSPMKCIDYLTRMATNDRSIPNYTFFENAAGINFVSLDSLYSLPVLFEFNEDATMRRITKAGSAVIDVTEGYKQILSFNAPTGFNYTERCLEGMYGSQLISIDPVTKKYSSKLYRSNDDFDKRNHLNPMSVISDKAFVRSEQVTLYAPKHYNGFNGYQDATDSKYVQQRTSLIALSKAFRVNITVPGRTDYMVGQKVSLDIGARDGGSDKDEIYSGNYLIGKIAHRIFHTKHEIDMELIKDSLTVDLNKGSPKK